MGFLLFKIFAQMAILLILSSKNVNTDAPAAKVSDFNFPTAEESRNQMLLYGTRKVSGANNFFADDVSQSNKYKDGGWFSPDILIGVEYFVGFAMGLCFGGETELLKISIKDEEIWNNAGSSYDKNGKLRGFIDKKNFHGEENGIRGYFSFYKGNENQLFDTYIRKFNKNPAFRGLSYIVFEKFYVGNQTQVPVFDFLLKRIPTTNTVLDRYSDIDGNCNPSVVIYDILTNTDYGIAIDKDLIDLTTFSKVAEKLYDENLGLSITYEDKYECDAFVSEVLKTISGVLIEDAKTGKFKLKLIRDDYNVDTIQKFDTSNIMNVNSFSRNTKEKLYSQGKIVYCDEKNFYKERIAQFHNQASDSNNVLTVNYPWITKSEIANNLAMRDSIPATINMSSLEIETAKIYGLEVGDPVKIEFLPLGIENMIFRINEIDYGTFRNNTMNISLVQDNFGIQLSSYATPPDNQWNGFDFSAHPCIVNVIETPYFFKQDGYNIMTFADNPSSVSLNYDIYTKNTLETVYNYNGTSNKFTPNANLELKIDAGVTNIIVKGDLNIEDFKNAKDSELLKGENLCLIISSSGQEFINFKSMTYDDSTQTYTLHNVNRGLVDTIPKNHEQNSKIWFISKGYAFNNYEFNSLETIDIKPLTITTSEKLSLDKAILTTFTFEKEERNNLPPAPVALKVNGRDFWNYSIGQEDLRLDYLVRTYEELSEIRDYFTTKPPAFGQGSELQGNIADTVTIEIYDQNDVLLKTHEQKIGNTYPLSYSFIFTDETTINPTGKYYDILKVKIYSKFQSITSYDSYNLVLTRS